MEDNVILAVKDLHTHFFTPEGVVKAVNGVSFSLRRGSILGIAGESGCGKTMTALSILGLVPYPGRILEGEILFEGRDLVKATNEELRQIRGRDVAMIFQDPVAGLNPILPIGTQVEEVITSHMDISPREAKGYVLEALARVGLPDPDRMARQYPFQLSGGMAQRVMIAMAMVLDPQILIADEPTSNLDVTMQAEILAEIRQLRTRYSTSVILITHDWGVLAQMAEEIVVMYAGSIVEYASTEIIFKEPRHPYTRALLDAMPRLDQGKRVLQTIRGAPPSLVDLPDQCAFIPRCSKARNECRIGPRPPLELVGPDHWVACYNPVRYYWDDEPTASESGIDSR